MYPFGNINLFLVGKHIMQTISTNMYRYIILFVFFFCVVRDPDLVRRIGVATALEVRATGIQYTFAPCIAVRTYTLFC